MIKGAAVVDVNPRLPDLPSLSALFYCSAGHVSQCSSDLHVSADNGLSDIARIAGILLPVEIEICRA